MKIEYPDMREEGRMLFQDAMWLSKGEYARANYGQYIKVNSHKEERKQHS
jgi:hypothetical protein